MLTAAVSYMLRKQVSIGTLFVWLFKYGGFILQITSRGIHCWGWDIVTTPLLREHDIGDSGSGGWSGVGRAILQLSMLRSAGRFVVTTNYRLPVTYGMRKVGGR